MADTPKVSPSTEMEGENVDRGLDRPVMENYKATKGWVKDSNGRFHEVDDVERTIQAYPGYEKVKSGDVVKSKVGYEVPAEEVASTAVAEAAKVAEDAKSEA